MTQQSFTVEFDKIVPQLITDCGVCRAYNPATKEEKPEAFTFKALWDTGATCTTISKNIVNTLGLDPVGFCDVSHAGGDGIARLYILNIILPNGLISRPMRVIDGVLGDFDILIGMDVITQGDFAVTHSNGKTTFSFHVPSVNKIDFEKAPTPVVKTQVPGRNDPCPCGSGKKYKKCCGKC